MPPHWESAALRLTELYESGKVKPHRVNCRERGILPMGGAGVACALR